MKQGPQTEAQRAPALADPMPVRPHARPFNGHITPPGSKSLTNRALLLAGLATGRSIIRQSLIEADDTARMIEALRRLGAGIERESTHTLRVQGVAGRWKPQGTEVSLDLGNAGTATRFLAAASVLSPVPVVIDGNARMRQRPIGELTGALAALGVRIQHLGTPDCPPVRITPPDFDLASPKIEFGPLKSSQFVSALLLIAPWISGGLTIRHSATVTSPSYIWMSLRLLERLGASVQSSEDLRVIRVGPGDGADAGMPGFDLSIEPDASSATYWWAAAAIVPRSSAMVRGLGADSLQGDASFPSLLERMGASVERHAEGIACTGPADLRSIAADMTDMPDAAMSLAAVASFARGASIIRGLQTLRVKESDRIAAMETELAKIGVRVETNYLGDPGAIRITPPPTGVDCSASAPPVEFDTYDDHRMAMSLALIGLRRPNVLVRDPACVNKTYPTFWRDLSTLG